MTDTTHMGFCPICDGALIADEPLICCDRQGRTTGDYAEDIFDGSPQNHWAHPGCAITVAPDPETV